jgi:uncharacterized protein
MAAKKTKKSKVVARKPVAKRGTARAAKKSAAKARKRPVHEIVHWEIQSQNPAVLHEFYTGAFGWKIDTNNPMRYGMVASKGDAGINGGIGGSEAPGSRVIVYASVPRIDPVLERIESLGGRTVMPRTDVGPVVMALYSDPEGHVMGLIEG